MDLWTDGIEKHPAYLALTEAEAALSAATAPEDDAEIASLARAYAVVSAIRGALGAVDPQLQSELLIREIAPTIDQVRDSARAYTSSRDAAHLSTIHAQLDTLLLRLGLGALVRPEMSDALRRSLKRYRQDAHEFLSRLGGQVEAASRRVERTRLAADELDTRIAERATEVGSLIAAKLEPLEDRLGTLSDAIVAESTKVGSLLATEAQRLERAGVENQRRIDAWFTEHDAKFKTARDRSMTDARTQRAEFAKSAGEQQQALRDEGDQLLAGLRAHEQEAAKRVSTIGALTVAGGFEEYAVQQKEAADRWSIGAVVALTFGAVPGFWFFVATLGVPGDVDLARFLERALIGTPLYGAAAYAAVQSARHRATERYARRMGLQLAAIGPYLATVPEADRNAALLRLAPIYFAHARIEELDDVAAAGLIRRIEGAPPGELPGT